MPCILKVDSDQGVQIFTGPARKETVITVVAEGNAVSARITGARYAGADLPVEDNEVRITIQAGTKVLDLFLDTSVPAEWVRVCEICEANPLELKVLRRFKSDPMEPRGFRIRGLTATE